MGANLVLHLKKVYFDAILSGEKLEEYRLSNDYYAKRLENREYENIVLLCGYPKRGDESKTIVMPYRGYRKTTITHPHFGNVPVDVYAIGVSR